LIVVFENAFPEWSVDLGGRWFAVAANLKREEKRLDVLRMRHDLKRVVVPMLQVARQLAVARNQLLAFTCDIELAVKVVPVFSRILGRLERRLGARDPLLGVLVLALFVELIDP